MTSRLVAELDDMWRTTLVPTETAELSVCGTNVSLNEADVAVAYDSSARRHLLIPFGTKERVVAAADWGTLAFRAPRELLHGERRIRYLDVVCKDGALNGVFSRLGAELVAEAYKNPTEAVGSCISTLENWRELFVSPPIGFGREKALGLLGELWLLRELVKRDPSSLVYWLGPLGAVHDFRHRSKAIEVKSSTRRTGHIVTIHGLEQLLAPDGGSLILFALSFVPVPHGTLSIGLLVDELLNAGVQRHQLEPLLRAEGLETGAYPELENATYELRESTAYAVDESFPRIVPSSFAEGSNPDRVVRLEYQLDLTGTPPSPLSATEVSAALADFLKP